MLRYPSFSVNFLNGIIFVPLLLEELCESVVAGFLVVDLQTATMGRKGKRLRYASEKIQLQGLKVNKPAHSMRYSRLESKKTQSPFQGCQREEGIRKLKRKCRDGNT